jgi:dihydrofolate reductase
VPEDQARFKALTLGSTVLMGRNTWESLPERFRPLPGRRNIVVTARPGYVTHGAEVVASVGEALAVLGDSDVWVIGGSRLYAAALPLAHRLEVTDVDVSVDGDTWAPEIGPDWRTENTEPAEGWLTSRTGIRYRFRTLTRR